MVTRAPDAGGGGGDDDLFYDCMFCIYIYDVFLRVRVGLFDLDSF